MKSDAILLHAAQHQLRIASELLTGQTQSIGTLLHRSFDDLQSQALLSTASLAWRSAAKRLGKYSKTSQLAFTLDSLCQISLDRRRFQGEVGLQRRQDELHQFGLSTHGLLELATHRVFWLHVAQCYTEIHKSALKYFE